MFCGDYFNHMRELNGVYYKSLQMFYIGTAFKIFLHFNLSSQNQSILIERIELKSFFVIRTAIKKQKTKKLLISKIEIMKLSSSAPAHISSLALNPNVQYYLRTLFNFSLI